MGELRDRRAGDRDLAGAALRPRGDAGRRRNGVTTFGTRTAGILDFVNVRSAPMPGGTLVLHHPTTRSKRLPHDPVDPHGLEPQVRIPDAALDPIAWVLDHWNEMETATR